MNTKPRNIRPLQIKNVRGYATNFDSVDQKEDVALEIRGFKQFREGMFGERDFGTHHRFSAYPTGITIIDGLVMYSAIYAKSYFLIYGLDASNNLRIFVYDDTDTTIKHTGNWVELTAKLRANIVSVSGTTVTLDTPVDILGTALTNVGASVNMLSQFIIIQETSGAKPALIASNTVAAGTPPYQFTVTTVVEPATACGWGTSGSVLLYRSTGILPDDVIDLGSSADTGRGYGFAYGATPHIRNLNIDSQSKVLALIGDSGSVPTMDQPFQIRRGGHLSPNSFTLGGALATGWATGVGIATAPEGVYDKYGLACIRDGATDYVWVGNQNSVIFKSSDGGATWDAGQTIAAGYQINAISFADKDNGMLACHNGKVYKTTNGGTTWVAEAAFAAHPYGIVDVFMESTTSAVACSMNGDVFVWASGTWTTATKPSSPAPVALNWVRKISTYIIAGFAWGEQNSGSPANYQRPWVYSTDSGGTWFSPTFPVAMGTHDAYSVHGLSIGTTNTVYGVVFNAGGTECKILKTTDGANFSFCAAVPAGFFAWTIVASGSLIVRAVGHKGGRPASIYSADGGANWTEEVVAGGTLSGVAYETAYWLSDLSRGFMVGTPAVVAKLNAATGTVGSGAFVGWQINKATLMSNFLKIGSADAYLTNGTTRDDQELGEGVRLKVEISEDTVTGKTLYSRMYVTALYAESTGKTVFMESDPIAQIFAAASADKFARIKLTFKLDLALVNKNLIGFACYIATNDVQTLPVYRWIENPDDYVQAAEILLSSAGWVVSTTNRFSHTNVVDLFSYVLVTGSGTFGQPSINDNLAHAVQTSRTYPRPRYISKASRTQGATVVIDEDDRTLRLSTYDGAGVHEDENFPNVSTDNAANKQKVNLIGRGELMGLSIMNDNVIALRASEIEIYDLQSGFQRIVGADVVAKKSIMSLLTPHGLTWAGASGIYFMPSDGSQIVLLNKAWQNFYNGDLKLTDNLTSFVTSAYRAAILTGFDDFYQEVWYQIKCNKEGGGTEYLQFRYSFQTRLWTVRELNIGSAAPAVFFSAMPTDKTFVIGYGAGVLKYPNQNGLFRHQDDCTVNGNAEPYTLTTANKGIPTKMLLNIGSLYSLSPNSVLWSVIADALTDGEAGSAWYMKIYGNRLTTNFSSKTFPVSAKPTERMVPARGSLEVLRIEIGLDTSNQLNMRQLDISTIVLNFITQPRIGTA